MSKRTRPGRVPVERTVTIGLSRSEIELLVKLAHFYERSMGPMRYLVRLTAGSEVRAKYRFIAQESRWLERFIASGLSEQSTTSQKEIDLEFSYRAVIAFWGRVLSSLNSRRSRRRLKGQRRIEREELERKFRRTAREIERASPGQLEREFETRRPVEVDWMREALADAEPEAPLSG